MKKLVTAYFFLIFLICAYCVCVWVSSGDRNWEELFKSIIAAVFVELPLTLGFWNTVAEAGNAPSSEGSPSPSSSDPSKPDEKSFDSKQTEALKTPDKKTETIETVKTPDPGSPTGGQESVAASLLNLTKEPDEKSLTQIKTVVAAGAVVGGAVLSAMPGGEVLGVTTLGTGLSLAGSMVSENLTQTVIAKQAEEIAKHAEEIKEVRKQQEDFKAYVEKRLEEKKK